MGSCPGHSVGVEQTTTIHLTIYGGVEGRDAGEVSKAKTRLETGASKDHRRAKYILTRERKENLRTQKKLRTEAQCRGCQQFKLGITKQRKWAIDRRRGKKSTERSGWQERRSPGKGKGEGNEEG